MKKIIKTKLIDKLETFHHIETAEVRGEHKNFHFSIDVPKKKKNKEQFVEFFLLNKKNEINIIIHIDVKKDDFIIYINNRDYEHNSKGISLKDLHKIFKK